MELTKQGILNHDTLIPGIRGYLVLVDKIEENKDSNPDITIESCKSLLEGLCLKGLSLLSDKYNQSKSLRTKCKNDLKVLTNLAFDEVYTDFVESQVHESLSNLLIDISVSNKIKDNAKRKVKEQAIAAIGKVSAIRNERGDISHGRDYPKTFESSVSLSKSIRSITDGICSFMIEQIAEKYRLKIQDEGKLIYNELEEFNVWLDETHSVLSVKVDFSKLLYENAYDKYEEYYLMEYLDSVDQDEDEVELPLDEPQTKIEENDKVQVSESPANDIEPEIQNQDNTSDVITLVSDFKSEKFWNNNRYEQVRLFAEEHNLNRDRLIEILNEFYYEQKRPLRDDVFPVLNVKPDLKERKTVVDSMTDRIVEFAVNLKID